MPTATWPMVGRDVELRVFLRALDDPACGGVALLGGAGFGKTRLATRALEVAAERGMAVASVRATRSSATVPLAALGSLLSQLRITPELDVGLFRAVADAIELRRGDRTMVLLVDDAQELDEPSAALLEQLVRREGIFVVFTVRTGERDTDAGTWLWNDERVERLHVGPLPKRDLRSLVVAAIGGPVDGYTLQVLMSAAGGNPMLLRELIQGALETGALASELGLWRLRGSLTHSPRLRDLMEQRLAGLSRTEREALELVALSDPVDLAMVERIVPLEAFETLEERGLLDVVAGASGVELRLNHPLYGDVVQATMPVLRRSRLCRALADTAEASGVLRGRAALRAAVWRLDAGGTGTPETTLGAARTALKIDDYRLAARLGQVAWETWPSVDAALVFGDALDLLGRCREAEQVLAAAVRLATDDRQRTDLSLRRASALFRGLGEAEAAEEEMASTAAAVSDPVLQRELDALRSNHFLLGGEVAKAVALAAPILAHPMDAAYAQASLTMATGLSMAGRTRDAITHADEGLALRVNLEGDEQLSTVGVYVVAQCLAHLYAGQLAQAEAIGEAGYQVAIERGNPDGQGWFASILGLVYLAQGRLQLSANMYREAATHFRAMGHPGQRWGLGGICLASAQMGDVGAALQALRELDGVAETPVRMQDVGIIRGRAWTAIAQGEITAGQALLVDALSLAEAWGQLAAAAETAHDLARVGSTKLALEHLERLAKQVDGDLIGARLTYCRAAELHDVDLAADAAERFAVIGANLYAAEAATLESTVAAAQGLPRRSAAASARAADLLARCEGASTPGVATASAGRALTRRETEIALLAAQDLSSRAIAERLFVSARTVDNHLQRIYTKLGIKGRSELPGRV